jgi:hypothetical protein
MSPPWPTIAAPAKRTRPGSSAPATDHQQQCSVAAGRSISLKRDSSRACGAPTPRDKERDHAGRKCRSERTPLRKFAAIGSRAARD